MKSITLLFYSALKHLYSWIYYGLIALSIGLLSISIANTVKAQGLQPSAIPEHNEARPAHAQPENGTPDLAVQPKTQSGILPREYFQLNTMMPGNSGQDLINALTGQQAYYHSPQISQNLRFFLNLDDSRKYDSDFAYHHNSDIKGLQIAGYITRKAADNTDKPAMAFIELDDLSALENGANYVDQLKAQKLEQMGPPFAYSEHSFTMDEQKQLFEQAYLWVEDPDKVNKDSCRLAQESHMLENWDEWQRGACGVFYLLRVGIYKNTQQAEAAFYMVGDDRL